MVKVVRNGKYTLYLTDRVGNRFTANVIYNSHVKDVLEFYGNDNIYIVDLKLKMCTIEYLDDEPTLVRNFDTGLDEYDFITHYSFTNLCNIKSGWL